MPCGAGMSGYTPWKGESLIKASAQFVQLCLNCDGKYPAKRILDAGKNGKSQKKDN